MARILIVEDERVVAWNIQEILKIFAHETVAIASSGDEALQRVADTQPDLVLMDIRLQGKMDGITAAQLIWTQFHIPIVYLTAHADEQTIEQAIGSAPFGYVIKPFNRLELHAAIKTALRRHQEEMLLQGNWQRLTTTVNSMADGVIATDKEGRITFMNPVAEALTGWRKEEALGKSASLLLELIHGETGEPIVNPIVRAIQDGMQTALPAHCLLRLKNGERRVIGDSAAPIKNDRGEVIGGVLVFQDITERQQAEDSLRQQAEQERLLGAIAQHIRQSLNLNEILETTVADVRQVLQIDRVIIYRFNPALPSSPDPVSETDELPMLKTPNWGGTVIAESLAAGYPSMLGCEIRDAYLTVEPCVRHYLRGGSQAIADIYDAGIAQCHVDMLATFEVRANLVVGILHGDRLWGLLAAQHCAAPRQWKPWEISLLKQLATQVGIAIQQSELYQQVQQLNAQLEQQVQERTAQLEQAFDFEALLRRITVSIRDSLDEQKILQIAIEELSNQLTVQFGNAACFKQDVAGQECLTIVAEYTGQKPDLAGLVLSVPDFPDMHHQLMQGAPLAFCMTEQRYSWSGAALLLCPMIDDTGLMLGDILLLRDRHEIFTSAEIQLVQQVSDQCAIAIRQARLYQAAQAQVKELGRLHRLKDDFLNTVSHELRTPISNVKLAIQMLEIILKPMGILDPKSGTVSQYFQVLNEECEREINLINDLLNLSNLEAGVEPLILLSINLKSWLPHIIEPFIKETSDRQQNLYLNLPDQLPILTSDSACLERILTELLTNACKYTPPGEAIVVSAQIVAATQGSLIYPSPSPRSLLQICITNTGIEIPPDEISRIFEKFYRVPNSDPWKYSGTGLGLALTKKLAEYIGAAIRVESDNNQTRFILEFDADGWVFESSEEQDDF
jgi:PAS domain S-box-containing protein